MLMTQDVLIEEIIFSFWENIYFELFSFSIKRAARRGCDILLTSLIKRVIRTQFLSAKQISVLVEWDWHARMRVDLDSWPERCLRRDQRRCWRKHQNSSTSKRVTQQRARETRPRMDLTFYWCSMVNRWHSRWQRGSNLRSTSNFSSRSLAWSITTNMCSLRKTFADWSKSPGLYHTEALSISTQEARVPCYHFSSMITRQAASLGEVCCRPAIYRELSWRTVMPLVPTTSFPFQITNPMKPRETDFVTQLYRG